MRAPPDFPLPFDAIESRILKQFFPIGVPCVGYCSNDSKIGVISFFNEGDFLTKRFSSFLKLGIAIILLLI